MEVFSDPSLREAKKKVEFQLHGGLDGKLQTSSALYHIVVKLISLFFLHANMFCLSKIKVKCCNIRRGLVSIANVTILLLFGCHFGPSFVSQINIKYQYFCGGLYRLSIHLPELNQIY